jgi:hypothetical protein
VGCVILCLAFSQEGIKTIVLSIYYFLLLSYHSKRYRPLLYATHKYQYKYSLLNFFSFLCAQYNTSECEKRREQNKSASKVNTRIWVLLFAGNWNVSFELKIIKSFLSLCSMMHKPFLFYFTILKFCLCFSQQKVKLVLWLSF